MTTTEARSEPPPLLQTELVASLCGVLYLINEAHERTAALIIFMFSVFHSSCSPKVTRAVGALTAGSYALAPHNGAHTVYKIDRVIV